MIVAGPPTHLTMKVSLTPWPYEMNTLLMSSAGKGRTAWVGIVGSMSVALAK